MNRFFHMMRLASSVIKSRGFAVSVLAVLMSLTVYAVSSTTNTVYIRADQQTTILTTSQRDLDAILEECGISVSQHDTVDFSGFDGNVAEINITRAFPVVIRADNTTYQVMMTEGTVADALNRAGIDITTHIARCAGISDTPFALDDAAALAAQVSVLESRDEGFALLDASVEEPMKTAIRAAGSEGDSVGGILETAILGLPAGVGEPYFDSVESLISHMAFSVPAVKGIEFGTGFGFADLKGSEANDAFRMKGDSVVTATNHNAGINGGITNGMPVVFRTAVKPTPSIYKEQETVDYIAKQDAPLSIQGRHDPCIVPRAAIVQTCAAALAVGDLMTARYGTAWMERPTSYRREGL